MSINNQNNDEKKVSHIVGNKAQQKATNLANKALKNALSKKTTNIATNKAKSMITKILFSPFGFQVSIVLIVVVLVCSLGNVLSNSITKLESDLAKKDLEAILGDDIEMTLDNPIWGYSKKNIDPLKWDELTPEDQYKFIANYTASQFKDVYDNESSKFYEELTNEANKSKYEQNNKKIDESGIKNGDVLEFFDYNKTLDYFNNNSVNFEDLKVSTTQLISIYTVANGNVLAQNKRNGAIGIIEDIKEAFKATNLGKSKELYNYISGRNNIKFTEEQRFFYRDVVYYEYHCECDENHKHNISEWGKKCDKCNKEILRYEKVKKEKITYTIRTSWFESSLIQKDISSLYDYLVYNIINDNLGEFEIGNYIINTKEFKEKMPTLKKDGVWEAIQDVKYRDLIRLNSFSHWYKPNFDSFLGSFVSFLDKDFTDCEAFTDSPNKSCHEDYFNRGDGRHDENSTIINNSKNLKFGNGHPFHKAAKSWDGTDKSVYLIRDKDAFSDGYEYNSKIDINNQQTLNDQNNQPKTFKDKYIELTQNIVKILEIAEEDSFINTDSMPDFDEESVKQKLKKYFNSFSENCPFKNNDELLNEFVSYALKNNVDPYLAAILLEFKTDNYLDFQFTKTNNFSFVNFGTNKDWKTGVHEYIDFLNNNIVKKQKIEIVDYIKIYLNKTNKEEITNIEIKIKNKYKNLTGYEYAGISIGSVKGALSEKTIINDSMAWTILQASHPGNRYPAVWLDLQCTAFVSGRINLIFGKSYGLPNGKDVARYLSNVGYGTFTTDKIARTGSVLSFNTGDPYGHVAFVESVEPDGSLVISEGNVKGYKYGIRIKKYKSIQDRLNQTGERWVGQTYPKR